MKNKLATLLQEAKRKGTVNGINFALGIVFLAMNNITDEFIADEEKQKELQKT